MHFNIRPLTHEDYDTTLVGWWNDWGWNSAPSREFLPQDGVGGIMVLDNDEPVCAGFMYNTNSSIAWIDWIVSSKTYRKKPNRKEALKLLVSSLTSIAENTNHKYVYSLSKSRFTQDVFRDNGYTLSNQYNVEMIKIF
jgi:hypothetical protein